MTKRVFVVGTDTDVGKTTLVCALLERAYAIGKRVMPYKPAQSGCVGASDAQRLHAAARLGDLALEQIVAFDFPLPLAPGIAECSPHSFGERPEDDTALAYCRDHLERGIETVRPELVLVEGAGGLWVPMPGGTWQPRWIAALASHVVVVGRAGLGTINHTLCTIDALRRLDLEPIGFYLVETTAPDASSPSNAAVISSARDVPHLGTLPHAAASPRCLLTPLLDRL
ncbi:MAG: dethiobiotin synthase [Myxococcales bacterium]|nr:dethiobiotin synthase [Myxococcales bacterium]